MHEPVVCRQVSPRQNEKHRRQMFASRLDSAHSHREPICRSAAQLFMGHRNKAARMQLNPLSFSNNLGFRTPPPQYFYSHCMPLHPSRWAAVRSRVHESVWLFISVYLFGSHWDLIQFSPSCLPTVMTRCKNYHFQSICFNRLLWEDFHKSFHRRRSAGKLSR